MKAAVIHHGPDTLLDHIAPLSILLNIPLLLTDPKSIELTRKFYPETKILEQDPNPAFLAEHFDVIFVSSLRFMIEMLPYFPLLHKKNMRIVYCPHGNSDKTHVMTKECHAPQDISLIYGQHMQDLLHSTGTLPYLRYTVVTGNYRKAFFDARKDFYRPLVEKALLKLDLSKKTILYTPTWGTDQNPSSFFSQCDRLISQLPGHFNLLIRLHPYLFEHNDPARTLFLIEKNKDHPQVLFLDDFPPVYPLFDFVDLYLGDFSSIGYDFLSANKPLYFFESRSPTLHKAGLKVPQEVFSFIEKTLTHNQTALAPVRQEIYTYAFGDHFPSFQQDLFQLLQ